MNNNITLSESGIEEAQRSFLAKVYSWMAFALAVTGGTAYYISTQPQIINALLGNGLVVIGLIVLQLFLVVQLSLFVRKISASTAVVSFILYSILTGITFSTIFLAYTASSIASTFFVTAGTFAVMSIYGYVTKTNLSSWGNILFMVLVGVILGSLVNIFLKSETIYWVMTFLGVFVFVGLIAYDTQKLKAMSLAVQEGTDDHKKASIVGALSLYLDFINLFLMLLRIMGDRK